MKGLSTQELTDVTDFVQKYHRFGYIPEKNNIIMKLVIV